MEDYLAVLMNQEFDTVVEDGSVSKVCVNGLLKGGLYRQVGGLFIKVHALWWSTSWKAKGLW